MIEFHQALQAAFQVVKEPGAGDLAVELTGNKYSVNFSFVTAEKRNEDYVVDVLVDAITGKVLDKLDKGKVPVLHAQPAARGWEKFITPKRVYDIALETLQGFSAYDHHGRFSIRLHGDQYYVTFPLVPDPEESPGAAGPDYAVQLHIDAANGKVLQFLVAS